MNRNFFAPGVIEGSVKPASRLRAAADFAGACALVAVAYFLAGWLL